MQMYSSKFKVVARTVVEEHDPESKPDTVYCVNKSYYIISLVSLPVEFLRILLHYSLYCLYQTKLLSYALNGVTVIHNFTMCS